MPGVGPIAATDWFGRLQGAPSGRGVQRCSTTPTFDAPRGQRDSLTKANKATAKA